MDAKGKICEYFMSGCTSRQYVGLELEHFVIKDGKPLNYSDGVADILSEVTRDAKKIFTENGNILGADMGDYTITLEPGAQLEVSVKPFENTDDIKMVLENFYANTEPIIKKHGAKLVTEPVVDERYIDGIELIPKDRYRYMDMYFQQSGTMGRYMMRASASTQVSVDYESETDFVRKFRTAYLISPLLALISASGDEAFKRLEIWDNVDGKRTYIPSALFSDSFGFEAYAKELLNIPAIFVPDGDGFVYTGDKTIAELARIYGSDGKMTEHYLSMAFPDVRLKRYIEIRIADAMPYERAIEYAELIKSIFYSDAVDEILKRYKDIAVSDIIKAKQDIRKYGKDARVYGRKAETEMEYLINFMR